MAVDIHYINHYCNIPKRPCIICRMQEYYSRRAREYEAVYHRDDPIRQGELAEMETAIQKEMRGKRVLEVACGTGYWTERAAKTVEHITAIDAVPETLEIARAKKLPLDKVDFRLGDAYRLDVTGTFDAGLAMFWLSHVPKARIKEFLHGLHAVLEKGSTVFVAENMFQKGIGGDLIRKPGIEDTFKRRTLTDGSVHDVLKNYYDRSELEVLFSPFATDLKVEMGTCFYRVRYTTTIK